MPRIVKDPEVLCGKATIEGTRISVEQVLAMLAAGAPEAEILDDFPFLTRDDIQACLRYALELVIESAPPQATHRLAG